MPFLNIQVTKPRPPVFKNEYKKTMYSKMNPSRIFAKFSTLLMFSNIKNNVANI
jgi:hypothetical protein